MNEARFGSVSEITLFETVGLINPIQVNEQLSLIAGLHRLEACKSIGWEEIDAQILTVDDITAERIEIAENLFRKDLTVLERGQQYKRLKDLYEAEFSETKTGQAQALKMNQVKGNNVSAESAPTFTKHTAAKTKKPERTIQEEVQVATNISNEVQTIIKDLPVADNKSELLKLSRFNETAQGQIAVVLSNGKVEKGKAASFLRLRLLFARCDYRRILAALAGLFVGRLYGSISKVNNCRV